MSRAGSIAALVSAVLWRTRVSRAAESALLATAAGLATACALELSGAPAFTPAGLAAQSISALCCGWTWWGEHRQCAVDAALSADRELAQRGALLTAFEHEARGAKLGPLLAERVLERLPPDSAARAAHRPTLAFVAAPLAALAMYFALPERSTALPEGVPGMLERVAATLIRAAARPGRSEEQSAELVELAAALRAASADPVQADEAPALLAECAPQLSAALSQVPAGMGEEPNAELNAALDLAQAALARLGGGPGVPGGASASPGSAATAQSGLQNAPVRSTMAGSARDEQPLATPPSAIPAPATIPGPEAGTAAGRWWPPEYDDVVAAWHSAGAGDRP